MQANRRDTSSRDKTVGTRCGRFARVTSFIHGSSARNTSRYKNSSADSA